MKFSCIRFDSAQRGDGRFELRIDIAVRGRGHDNVRHKAALLGQVHAVGREIFPARDVHGAAVRERDGRLAAALAGRVLADDGRPVILLQRSCKKLRRTVGVAVDDDRHRHLDTDAVALRDGLFPVAVDAHEQVALRQQMVQDRDELREQAAGVIAQVEHERLCTEVEQLIDRLYGTAAAAGLKVADLDIADAVVHELIRHRVGIDDRAVERDGLALAGRILDGELERLVELGADGALHVRERLARDILPVDRRDDVALLEAGFRRGGIARHRRDAKALRLIVELDGHTDAGVLVVGVHLVGLVFLSRHVIAPLVADGADDRARRSIADGRVVRVADIVFVHDLLDLRKLQRELIVAAAAEFADKDHRRDQCSHQNAGHTGKDTRLPAAHSAAFSAGRHFFRCLFLWLVFVHAIPPDPIAARTGQPPMQQMSRAAIFRPPGSFIQSKYVQSARIVERVLAHAVDRDFPVQMRAGGVAGRADITDRLALGDLLTDGYRDGAHMAVERGDAVAMVDDNAVAVTGHGAGRDDRAAVGRNDGRAVACADVHAGVILLRLIDRVVAPAELRGDVVAGRARPHHGAGGAVGFARVIAGVVVLVRFLLAAQLLDLLVDLRLDVFLLLLILIVDALIGVDIRFQAGEQRIGLRDLLLQRDLLGLELGLLILQLGAGILELRLDGFDLFAGGRHVGLYLFIICNDLADHVHAGKEVGQAGRLEQDGDVRHLAVLLKVAHAAAEADRLGLFFLLGGLELDALVLDLLVIGRDLLLDELDLLLGQIVFLIERSLLIHHAGFLRTQAVDGLLLLFLLGLQLLALLRKLVDLRLRCRAGIGRDQCCHERDDENQRQQHANNGSNDFAVHLHSISSLDFQIVANGREAAEHTDEHTHAEEHQQQRQRHGCKREHRDDAGRHGGHDLADDQAVESPLEQERDQTADEAEHKALDHKRQTDEAIRRTDHLHDGDLLTPAERGQLDGIGHDKQGHRDEDHDQNDGDHAHNVPERDEVFRVVQMRRDIGDAVHVLERGLRVLHE